MQRRVAAIYFVFFLVVGASAYSFIAVAEEPGIDMGGQVYSQGDTFAVDGQEYAVANLTTQVSSGGGGHGGGGGPTVEHVGRLEWTNESARFTSTLANNSTVPPTRVSFSGQEAYYTTTLQEGDTVTFNGSETTVSIPDVDSPSNFSLVQGGNNTTTFALNDTLTYRGNATTVVGVTSDEVQLAWGDDYRVLIPNESDPNSFRMVQQFNVSQRLASDPAVENRTITRDDGQRYVVFRENGSTRLLSEYVPEPDVGQIQEGDTMTVGGNETTVANVTASEVVVAWTAPTTNSVEFGEGTNVTLNDQQYIAHFPTNDSLVLSQQVAKYEDGVRRQEYFQERLNGLWAVAILSGIAAILVLALAYLPVRG